MSTFRRAGFATVVLLASLTLAEGAARLFGPGLMPPDRSRDAAPGQPIPGEPNLVGDAATGWRIVPGPNRLFGVPEVTNVDERGVRGPSRPVDKPAGTRRVLLLGDSSVYGVMVGDAQTFAARTEAALRKVDPGVEVHNAGCPGYSSWQARRALETRLLDLEPDLVVVAALWSDTQGADAPDQARFGGGARPLLARSHAYVLLRDAIITARWGSRLPPPAPGAPEPVAHGLGMPRMATWRVPLDQYRDNLDAIAELVDGRVAFLVLPSVRDPEQGRVGDHRDAWRATMREAAARHDAPLADAAVAFQGGDAQRLFLDEVHPSAEGHARVAEVLAQALEGWARQP